ncbi:helix-turn-helix transcriptional regulator [Zhihengliuella halotolerans]|uniref:Transcriptional regulator n=1 Tax=Zhihengliuella halotolerans TaxID=370736 RepID=A0A4Q8ACR3_9MICC|nr:WYL domain-containing protein [Zhihengliuella halotolerans]RZU61403.1 transcriptional regulator [Zhihengliuella halotolerans]
MTAQTKVDQTERFVSLFVTLLQAPRRGLTKAQLRHAIDGYRGLNDKNFDSKFERDKAHLRELGIEITTEENAGASSDSFFESGVLYRLDPTRSQIPAIQFTSQEAMALALASSIWSDPNFGGAAGRALARLTSTGSFDVDSSRFTARLTVGEAVLTPLTQAALRGEPVSFAYRNVTGEESLRRVAPWGLGSRFGLWYLIAFDLERREVRMFRLSRIVSAIEATAAVGVPPRPEGFSAREYLSRLSADEATTTARVRLAHGRGQDLRATATRVGASEIPGFDDAEFAFHDAEATAGRLAGLGPDAEVIGPPELRDAVVRRLHGALAAQSAPLPDYALKKTVATGRSSGVAMAARALSIVAFVQHRGSASRAEIREHFGISESTLTTDLQRISMLGPDDISLGTRIDLDFEADPVQISTPPELEAPLVLSLTEAFVMVVGLRMLAQVEGTVTKAAVAALTKLEEATKHLPVLDAIDLQSRAEDDLELSGAIKRAVAEQRTLTIDYFSPARDEITGRTIEPIRFLESGPAAYVQAYCRERQGIRLFRLDRIFGHALTEETFELGDRHSVDTHDLTRNLYTPQDDDGAVVLAFAARLDGLLRDYAPTRVAAGHGEHQDFRMGEVRIAGSAHAHRLVAEHGGDVFVAGPQTLAAETAAWLRRALSIYSIDSESGNAP